jgi:hypothetical protein
MDWKGPSTSAWEYKGASARTLNGHAKPRNLPKYDFATEGPDAECKICIRRQNTVMKGIMRESLCNVGIKDIRIALYKNGVLFSLRSNGFIKLQQTQLNFLMEYQT